MKSRITFAMGSAMLTLGTLALPASRRSVDFSLECGSLGLPDGQVLIRIPSDPTGLRVNITTAPAPIMPDVAPKTTLRVRAGADSLSCYSTGSASFILNLSGVPASTIELAIEMPHVTTFEAKDARDLPRGSMELAPTASGSFTW